MAALRAFAQRLRPGGRRWPALGIALKAVGVGLVTLSLVAGPQLAWAGLSGATRVATGLASPIFATHASGRPELLFIAERGTPVDGNVGNSTANIRILNLTTGVVAPTPFLTIPGLDVESEGGLLGLAFHPDFANNGKLYVYVTANDSVAGTPFSSYIREYTRSTTNPDVADPTFRPILDFTQPQANHNGGWIGFSPNDGLLYIMSGDGGGGNDQGTGHTEPGGNAQDLTNNLLGKALRIDVNSDGFTADPNRNYAIPLSNPFVAGPNAAGDDEIWAYGLRNPFRAGFDRITGDLWIGDVGQGAREEVDFQSAASPGGEDYGWRRREGFIQTPGVGGPLGGATNPIYDYLRPSAPGADQNFTGTTVTGGLVYRGPDPELQGLYFFGDSSVGKLWTLNPPEGTEAVDVDNVTSQLAPNVGSIIAPVAFGEDANGNLYIVDIVGSVFRINTTAVEAGDFNSDGFVDGADLDLLKAGFGVGTTFAAGDADRDGDVDGGDFLVWQRTVGATPLVEATASPVPEPQTTSLAAMAAMALAAITSRRRRRR